MNDIDRTVAEKKQQLVDLFLSSEVVTVSTTPSDFKRYEVKSTRGYHSFHLKTEQYAAPYPYTLYFNYGVVLEMKKNHPVVAKCRAADEWHEKARILAVKKRFIERADEVLGTTTYTGGSLGQFDVYEEVPKPRRWWEFWR